MKILRREHPEGLVIREVLVEEMETELGLERWVVFKKSSSIIIE